VHTENHECPLDTVRCDNGQCIPEFLFCSLEARCFDGSLTPQQVCCEYSGSTQLLLCLLHVRYIPTPVVDSIPRRKWVPLNYFFWNNNAPVLVKIILNFRSARTGIKYKSNRRFSRTFSEPWCGSESPETDWFIDWLIDWLEVSCKICMAWWNRSVRINQFYILKAPKSSDNVPASTCFYCLCAPYCWVLLRCLVPKLEAWYWPNWKKSNADLPKDSMDWRHIGTVSDYGILD